MRLFPCDTESEISSNGDTNQNALERAAYADASSLLDKEEQDIERAITGITEVQVCIRFSR